LYVRFCRYYDPYSTYSSSRGRYDPYSRNDRDRYVDDYDRDVYRFVMLLLGGYLYLNYSALEDETDILSMRVMILGNVTIPAQRGATIEV